MIALYIIAGLIGLVIGLHVVASVLIGKALKPEIAAQIRQYPDIEICQGRWITLKPKHASGQSIQPSIGLVFIPGGYADAEAYIPLLLRVAQQGVTCLIASGPGRLAILDRFATARVIDAHPHIQQWFLGGHSLGGAVMNMYIRERHQYLKGKGIVIRGLVFLGSYFIQRHSLAAIPLPSLSIYGTEDGFAERFEPNEHHLTNQRTVIKIEGGNHGQFAHYGRHLHDRPAVISRAEQQHLAQQALMTFILQYTQIQELAQKPDNSAVQPVFEDQLA